LIHTNLEILSQWGSFSRTNDLPPRIGSDWFDVTGARIATFSNTPDYIVPDIRAIPGLEPTLSDTIAGINDITHMDDVLTYVDDVIVNPRLAAVNDDTDSDASELPDHSDVIPCIPPALPDYDPDWGLEPLPLPQSPNFADLVAAIQERYDAPSPIPEVNVSLIIQDPNWSLEAEVSYSDSLPDLINVDTLNTN
jgi:hypothetical protein